jgi:hypothetical protein
MCERTQSCKKVAVTQGSLSHVCGVYTFLVEDSKFGRSQAIVLNPLPVVVFLVFDAFKHCFSIEIVINKV